MKSSGEQKMVSVVMPVYNGAGYLQDAIDSIRQQTWENWELIIIDDSSTDGSDRIVENQKDSRILLVRNSRGKGVAAALNCGLEQVQGDYIARMDADDLSRPERLARQVQFLENHPEVNICGGRVQCFGSAQDLWSYPADDAYAKAWLIFDAPFAHPTVMLRRSVVEGGWRYDEHCGYVEDYELWVRGSADFTYANLEEVLLDYRIHSSQVGVRLNHEQRMAARKVRQGLFENLGLSPDPEELDLHDLISSGEKISEIDRLLAVEIWLLKLERANQKAGQYEPPAFRAILQQRWWQTCHQACQLGGRIWSVYRNSPLRGFAEISRLEEWKFALRCLARQPVQVERTRGISSE